VIRQGCAHDARANDNDPLDLTSHRLTSVLSMCRWYDSGELWSHENSFRGTSPAHAAEIINCDTMQQLISAGT